MFTVTVLVLFFSPLCLVLHPLLGLQWGLVHPEGGQREELRPEQTGLRSNRSHCPLRLTFLPRCPGLPVSPTGPSVPGDPVAPASPSGPGSPLTPWKQVPEVRTWNTSSTITRTSEPYLFSDEAVSTRRTFCSGETLHKVRFSSVHLNPSPDAVCLVFNFCMEPFLKLNSNHKPQRRALPVVLWLLVNQCPQPVLDHPGPRELLVFLVDPESRTSPEVKQWFSRVEH